MHSIDRAGFSPSNVIESSCHCVSVLFFNKLHKLMAQSVIGRVTMRGNLKYMKRTLLQWHSGNYMDWTGV